MTLDIFSAMKSFVSVAECNGFSAAARELHISTPALTKQIQQLEKSVGKKLLERTTRYLALTEAGESYLKSAKEIIGAIEVAKNKVHGLESDPHGKLTIGIPGVFNSPFYITILKNFLKKYPKIILETVDENSPGDLLKGLTDIAISEEKLNDKQLIREFLFSIPRGLFASPEYLKKNGVPKKYSDLKNHNCILYKRVAPHNYWSFPNNKNVPISGNFISNSDVNTLLGAIAGIGIVWCSPLVLQEEIKSKKLVEIKLDGPRLTTDVYLYYRPAGQGSNVKLFVDYLKQCLAHSKE